MKFLVGASVDPDPDSGAAGTVYQTSRALVELGHEVDEIWRKDLGRTIAHGNLHYLLELPRAYRREVAIRCAKRHYDAVILSQPHAYLAARYVREHVPGTVFLNRSHGWEGQVDDVEQKLGLRDRSAPSARRLSRSIMRSLLYRHQVSVLRWSDGLIVPASTVAGFIHEHHKLSRDRIGIVPEGLPRAFIDVESTSTTDERWSRLLYAGQFTSIKAPELVASVFNRVLKARPQTEAGWVCAANHHSSVEKLLSPDIRSRVTLHAWVPQGELLRIYDGHGLFIFPSYYEGFGKTAVEAMSRGLAVVASKAGGMPDLITPGANGFLADVGNVEAMTSTMLDLIDDPSKAKRIGAQARRDVSNLTWQKTARGICDFAASLIAMKNAGNLK